MAIITEKYNNRIHERDWGMSLVGYSGLRFIINHQLPLPPGSSRSPVGGGMRKIAKFKRKVY